MEESRPVLSVRLVTPLGSCANAGHTAGRNWPSLWLKAFVFDARLRQTKQRFFAPVVDVIAAVPALALTFAGLLVGLAAAIAAADGRWWLALALFVLNRVIDGLDGEVARATSQSTDEGGYADMVVDTIVYAAIPLGAAAGSDLDHIWPIAAVLVASFYVNITTWLYLAAVFEKRGRQAGAQATSVVMPPGLIEGAETVVFFLFMLAVPAWIDWTMGVMAAAVLLGAGLRATRGFRLLRQTSELADLTTADQANV